MTFFLRRFVLVCRIVSLALAALSCAKPAPPAKQAAPAPPSLLARPHVTLVAVTDWQATLKPCGCTVDLQKGGIERLSQWLGELRKQDDSVLVVHAGSLLHDGDVAATPAAQAQMQLRREVFGEALASLRPAAVAASSWDLSAGGTDTLAAYAKAGLPLVSLGPAPPGLTTQPMVLVKTASGVSVALLAVDPSDKEAERAALVRQHAQRARSQGAQVVVVLSNLGLRGSRRLARAVPGLDAIVVGQLDERVEPLRDLEREEDTVIVHAARHGAWLAALTLVPDRAGGPYQDADAYLPDAASELQRRADALQAQFEGAKAKATLATQLATPWYLAQRQDLQARIARANAAVGQPLPTGKLAAFRSVGLPWTAPTDPAMTALVGRYEKRAAASAEQLAAQPVPPIAGQPHYVGYGECMGCHMTTQGFSLNDAHSHAWQTLQDAGKTRDLDCVPCHVTGWQAPGGSALANVDKFSAVRCEACHGPGSEHAADPAGTKAAGQVGAVRAEVCQTCHTAQHSPRFDFVEYRKRLLVAGHGARLL